MIYADLPAGATVFVDASVFIHHFEPNPLFGPAATDFLERIEPLARGYDVLLCDIWGVVHNGVAAFPEACAALLAWAGVEGAEPLDYPALREASLDRLADSFAESLDLDALQAAFAQ